MSGADTLWAIHVEGPDDMIAAPSKDAGEREAALLNRYFARIVTNENDPDLRAVVVPWPYSADSHAHSLGRDWDKEGNRK